MSEETTEQTVEEILFERFVEMGQEMAALGKARDELKDTELAPSMEEGIVFGNKTDMLAFEYGQTTTCLWQKMVLDGVVTKEQIQPYIQDTPYRKVVSRARQPKAKGAIPNEEKLYAQSKALDMRNALDSAAQMVFSLVSDSNVGDQAMEILDLLESAREKARRPKDSI